jgi:acetyl-CoA carboxylase biotin carboxylase subunit
MAKLLVANRGEIAVRIIRAARELGIKTVAIYSDADQGTLPVRLADERIALKGNRAADSYLNADKVLAAAIQSGSTMLHPGYGFFSENGSFAKRVRASGITFVGPTPEVIELMGDKAKARQFAESCGVPVVPGTSAHPDDEQIKKFIATVGYPVLCKAVAGGSGRGMRIIREEKELKERISEARAEALSAFGNDEIILEKYLEQPRHIEVQVFGDGTGGAIHLGERDCSVQRRHQKLIEEALAANLHPKLRERILEAAVKLAQSCKYLSSGTVECLVENSESETGSFYFLEMNTRIQVEHPVTEIVTGVDLLKLQLKMALEGGSVLPKQQEITFSGHAIEFRLTAEDVRENFAPKTGKLLYLSRVGGVGVREDSWVEPGTTVSPFYDSLLSKVIVYGTDRAETIQRARSVLREYLIEGVPTTLEFHRWILEQKDFKQGLCDIHWVNRNYKGETLPPDTVGPRVLPPEAV